MRKEVKLGFAIGGVVLAVLVVYVLVMTGPSDKPDQVTLVTTPDTQAPTEPAPQVAEPARQPTGDPFVSAAPTGATPTGASATVAAVDQPAPANDPWSMALNSGRLPELMTQTPTPASTAPPAFAQPQVVGANTPSELAAPSAIASNAPAMSLTPATQPSGAAVVPATYKVKEGESFSSIAADLYGSANYYPHLIRANPTIDPRKLRPGMTINCPPKNEVVPPATPAAATSAIPSAPAAIDSRSEYRVLAGDSLYRISVKLYGKPDQVDAIYELNKAAIGPNQGNLKLGMVLKLPTPPTATTTAGR